MLALDLASAVAEAYDVKLVARKLRMDKAFQGHRHLLGGVEVSSQWHRTRHVEHQHRGSPGRRVDLIDLEVVAADPGDLAGGALTLDGVEDGTLDVEPKGITELPWLGFVRSFDPEAQLSDVVGPEAVTLQVGEEVAQRFLPDSTDALGRQLETALSAFDVSLVFHLLQQPVQPVDGAGGILAEPLLDLLSLSRRHGLAAIGVAQGALHGV